MWGKIVILEHLTSRKKEKKSTPTFRNIVLTFLFRCPKMLCLYIFDQFVCTNLSLFSTQTFQNTPTFLSKYIPLFIDLYHSNEHVLLFYSF